MALRNPFVPMVLWYTISSILVASITLVFFSYIRILLLRRRLPPGPLPLPLLGNYFDMRMDRPWVHWEKLSHQYDNPLLTLWTGHRPVVVANDAWTMSDLCDKRAHIYSSRPRMVMFGDMGDLTENNQVCLKYGEKWRLHRRLTHAVVGSQAVRQYRNFQLSESLILIHDFLHAPDKFEKSVERYACTIVSIVGWGRRTASMSHQVAQCALQFMTVVNLVIPGQQFMELQPWLSELPWWLNPLPMLIKKASTQINRYFYTLNMEQANGDAGQDIGGGQESFARKLMREQKLNPELSNTEVGNLTANLVGAGIDTTSGTLCSLVLALCVFREKQRLAQQEIDHVVGSARMPDWSDEQRLPYVTAFVNELLRWRTVTVLGGIPHAPTQDDEYRGYLIPEGTWIVANVWAIHRHPREYPDPDDFRPERFLAGQERAYPSKKGHHAWGWGRRQCSGQPLAEQGLWLVTAQLLWAFDVRPGLDDSGDEVPLDIFAYTKSENQRPEKFAARFIPRSAQHRDIIERQAVAARTALEAYGGETELKVQGS